MERLIIFADSSSYISNILLDYTLSSLKRNSDLDLILVVDTNNKSKARSSNLYKYLIKEFIRWIFNTSEYKPHFDYVKFLSMNIYNICFKNNVKIVKSNNINDLEFLEFLKSLKPNLGLAIGCPQIMRPQLISIFDIIVNYHNSLLPKYRGLHATQWSVYMGEKKTGFTYHIVNERVDDGNILIQDSIDINGKNIFELEIEKTLLAAKVIPKLLELMVNKYQGIPQIGEKSYYSLKDFMKITFIDDVSKYNFEEIIKRIKSFGFIFLKEYRLPITSILKCEKKGNYFITADNIAIKPIRFNYMPYIFAKLYYEIIKRNVR